MSKKNTRAFHTGDKSTDRTGYCNPPLHTRWQKGQSGNPRGRPRNSLNLTTIRKMLEEELAEPALVKAQDGRKYYVSKDRAFVKQLINDSFSGKARDKKLLLDVIFRVAEPHYPENDAATEMVAGGADALERYVQRVQRRQKMDDTAADDGEDPP